ncbi:hypothetical protein FPQ18DRAFT_380615 [Pyronema domesticum]|nr:hypothetical protein FPQ18DRAFT_380615 [Pyronema domesticum]
MGSRTPRGSKYGIVANLTQRFRATRLGKKLGRGRSQSRHRRTEKADEQSVEQPAEPLAKPTAKPPAIPPAEQPAEEPTKKSDEQHLGPDDLPTEDYLTQFQSTELKPGAETVQFQHIHPHREQNYDIHAALINLPPTEDDRALHVSQPRVLDIQHPRPRPSLLKVLELLHTQSTDPHSPLPVSISNSDPRDSSTGYHTELEKPSEEICNVYSAPRLQRSKHGAETLHDPEFPGSWPRSSHSSPWDGAYQYGHDSHERRGSNIGEDVLDGDAGPDGDTQTAGTYQFSTTNDSPLHGPERPRSRRPGLDYAGRANNQPDPSFRVSYPRTPRNPPGNDGYVHTIVIRCDNWRYGPPSPAPDPPNTGHYAESATAHELLKYVV